MEDENGSHGIGHDSVTRYTSKAGFRLWVRVISQDEKSRRTSNVQRDSLLDGRVKATRRDSIKRPFSSVRERQLARRRISDETVEVVGISTGVGNILKVGQEGAVEWEDILIRLSTQSAASVDF